MFRQRSEAEQTSEGFSKKIRKESRQAKITERSTLITQS